MKIEFLAPAEDEFKDAINYYNTQRNGLGFEFALEIHKIIERISQNPKAWSKISKRTRRCPANKFPYGVIYQIRNKKILIIAIMHFHRNPAAWKSRQQTH